MQEVMGGIDLSDDLWPELIKEADVNGDGMIDMNEFIELLSEKKIRQS